MAGAHITVSATELPHFKRLVEFVAAVEDHAHREVDLELREIVETLRADLARLKKG